MTVLEFVAKIGAMRKNIVRSYSHELDSPIMKIKDVHSVVETSVPVRLVLREKKILF